MSPGLDTARTVREDQQISDSPRAIERTRALNGQPQRVPSADVHIPDYPRATQVDLGEILPDSFQGESTEIDVPRQFTFEPDHWSAALLSGLDAADLDGMRVGEVGVGAGTNSIFILGSKNPASVTVADYLPELAPLAIHNMGKMLRPDQYEGKVFAYEGQQDLASFASPGEFDVVVACVPQMVRPEGLELEGADFAHYYDPDQYQSRLNDSGLGLNDVLLQQLSACLDVGGRAIINLAGRPGKDVLMNQLFRENGLEPRILHERVIPHHNGTSVSHMATIEAATDGGRQFEFFEDPAGEIPMNASTAERRRLDGEPVFHKIYVI